MPPTTSLEQVYRRAGAQGLLGRGTSVAEHVAHARAFGRLVDEPGASRCVDLGTGAGLPGLVLATLWPGTSWVFVDRRPASEAFVRWALGALDCADRATFRCADAAEAARSADLAGQADLVVARSFAPPAVTAECATGFARIGGRLLISLAASESADHWPPAPLAQLGLAVGRSTDSPSVAELRKVADQDPRFPRRTTTSRRNPLF